MESGVWRSGVGEWECGEAQGMSLGMSPELDTESGMGHDKSDIYPGSSIEQLGFDVLRRLGRYGPPSGRSEAFFKKQSLYIHISSKKHIGSG